jgi:tetratricopeptide (TPR) repeat protein
VTWKHDSDANLELANEEMAFTAFEGLFTRRESAKDLFLNKIDHETRVSMSHDYLSNGNFIPRGQLRVLLSILMTICMGVATYPAIGFAGDIHALSDVFSIPSANDIECPKTGISPAKSPAIAISANEAIGSLDKALRRVTALKALRVLIESPEVRDPAAASNLAAVALADHMPEAALALLLQANKIAPKDPVTWLNLAGISNYFGDYRDAFAVVSAAEKLPGAGIADVKTNLLVNKGNALLGLGRPQEAQAALNTAIKLSPNLPQAYTTMAYALGDQGKCSQAVRFLRAGAFRNPPKSMLDATQYAAEIDPDKPSPADLITHLPVMDAIDLSRGLTDSLPRVTYGTNYGQVKSAYQEWFDRMEDFKKRWSDAADEEKKSGLEAAKTYAMWKHSGSLSNELTAKRAEFLMRMLRAQIGTKAAEYPEFAEAEKTMEADVSKIADEANEVFQASTDAMMREYGACQALRSSEAQSACGKRVEILGKQKMCVVQTTAIGREGAALRRYELHAGQYYGEIFHRATAIAANFSDPAYHQYANAMIDSWRLGFYMHLRPVGLGTWYTDDMCDESESKLPEVRDTDDVKRSVICQAGKETKVSAKAAVVSAGFSCEKVEVKVSTPGPLSIFAQAEYEDYNPVKKLTDPKERYVERLRGGNPDKAPNLRQWGAAFDGKLTIYGGVEATLSAGGVTHTANGGAFVTVDGMGNISDVAGKSELSTAVGMSVEAGGVGVGVETKIGSSPINIPSMPSFVTAPSGLAEFPN